MTDYVVVFGAAVRRNGRPSAALRARIDLAARWGREDERAMFLATGAVGTHGPAEAEVIGAALVDAGIDPARIIIEPGGRDTLESVRRCHAILRERGDCQRIVCATSGYHQPRCALLFRLLGYRVVMPTTNARRSNVRRRLYARLLAKEVVATPYDAALLLLRRRAAG